MSTLKALSTLKTRHLLLAVGVMSMLGCAATLDDEKVDYGDEVDTPDVMIQDTDGKTTLSGDKKFGDEKSGDKKSGDKKFGDESFGLAADAKEHDQQNQPDQLEAGLAQNSKAQAADKPEQAVTPTAPAKSQVSAAQQVEPTPAKVEPVAKAESVARAQKAKQQPKVTQEQQRRQDNALEVADPLLGEVEPG
jgi:hypothetical protein